MKKVVNIEPSLPITTIVPAIYSPIFNCKMSVGDILNCLCAKARVTEVLKDGSLVKLNLSNYDKVHEVEEVVIKKEESITVKEEETIVIEEPTIKEEIVIPAEEEEIIEEEQVQEEDEFSGMSEEEIKEYKELLEMEEEIEE